MAPAEVWAETIEAVHRTVAAPRNQRFMRPPRASPPTGPGVVRDRQPDTDKSRLFDSNPLSGRTAHCFLQDSYFGCLVHCPGSLESRQCRAKASSSDARSRFTWK